MIDLDTVLARLADDSAAPMHQRLSDGLRRLAERQQHGGRMPTESEIMRAAGVSRSTVRRAIESLVTEGLLIRHQGRGTFVHKPRLVHALDQLQPIVAIYAEAGRPPHGELLSMEWQRDGRALPVCMHAVCDEALYFRRRYTARGLPPSWADIYLPGDLALHVSRGDIEAHPVYHVLQHTLGLTPHYANITVRGVSDATDTDLDEPGDASFFVLERVTYDENDRLLECTQLHMRSDSFEIKVRANSLNAEHIEFDVRARRRGGQPTRPTPR